MVTLRRSSANMIRLRADRAHWRHGRGAITRYTPPMKTDPPGGARNHHFVPQYYLKGFATPRSKDGWLTVFDLKERKSFKTRPRNVAARRDYHRVDIDGVDPNIVETQLATLDDRADKAFRRVIAAQSIADRDDFSFVLTLIAQIVITGPAFREMRAGIIRQMGSVMMHNMVASPERWAEVTNGASGDPRIGGDPIPYEEARAAVENGEIVPVAAKEVLIEQEWKLWPAILPILEGRKWTLLIAPSASAGFVTSDRPFSLKWNDASLDGGPYGPGLGTGDTNLIFPLSRDLALIGSFEAGGATVEVDETRLAVINLMIFVGAMRQVYGAADFVIMDADRNVRPFSQSALWRQVCQRSPADTD